MIKVKSSIINDMKSDEFYEKLASEEDFLRWYKKPKNLAKYERPSLAIDVVIFGFNRDKRRLDVLLTRREKNPFREFWSLPGRFAKSTDHVEFIATDNIEYETQANVSEKNLQFVDIKSNPDRDPRGWIISVSFVGFVDEDSAKLRQNSAWFDAKKLPKNLAFDHAQIIAKARENLVFQIDWNKNIFSMLGQKFAIVDAVNLYNAITNNGDNTSNFAKKFVHGRGFFAVTEIAPAGVGRPSRILEIK